MHVPSSSASSAGAERLLKALRASCVLPLPLGPTITPRTKSDSGTPMLRAPRARAGRLERERRGARARG